MTHITHWTKVDTGCRIQVGAGEQGRVSLKYWSSRGKVVKGKTGLKYCRGRRSSWVKTPNLFLFMFKLEGYRRTNELLDRWTNRPSDQRTKKALYEQGLF